MNGPWQLQVARLLATLAITTAVLNLVLTSSTVRLHRSAARRLHGHRILIGPSERVEPHLRDTPAERISHPIDFGEEPIAGVLNPEVCWISSTWVESVAATRAADVVIAGGRDDRNLELLAELTAASRPIAGQHQHVMVEIDDRELSLWVSMAVASSHRDRDIEIVCWPDTMARRAAARLIENATDSAATRDTECVAVLSDSAPDPIMASVARRQDEWAVDPANPKDVRIPGDAARSRTDRGSTDGGHLRGGRPAGMFNCRFRRLW